jgi:leader peptidase (prepilin peptidase)/N-methyltransferase
MILAELPLWFLRAIAIGLGLVWGSFLNVVIYRLPRDMSVVRPASHCPACGAPVRAYDNLPVLSYLLLRGRARCCGARLSPRYPLVELIGCALSLAIVEVVLRALPQGTTLARAAAIYTADFALCLGLVAAAFIDAEYMYLPDPITIGGAVLGVATATLRGYTLLGSLLAAVLSFGIVWLLFVVLYARLRGFAGMGLGDAKLLMLAGAWFGLRGVLFAAVAGAVQATLVALLIWIVKGRIDEPEAVKAEREELQRAAAEGDEEAKEALIEDPLAQLPRSAFWLAPIPFGPFLILAVLEYLFAGGTIDVVWERWIGGTVDALWQR